MTVPYYPARAPAAAGMTPPKAPAPPTGNPVIDEINRLRANVTNYGQPGTGVARLTPSNNGVSVPPPPYSSISDYARNYANKPGQESGTRDAFNSLATGVDKIAAGDPGITAPDVSGLGGVGQFFGSLFNPQSQQYTPQQLYMQQIAANASHAANSAIDTGFWKGRPVYDRTGQMLGNPADVLGGQVGARPDLYAENNPYLRQAGGAANMAISGDAQQQLGARATDFSNTSAFAAGKINQAGNGVRGNQMDTLATAGGQAAQSQRDLGIVRDSALGRGPSAAENLARSQMDASVRAQAAQAAAARGGNVASAQRAAAQSATDTRLQSTAQLAAQRAQEQLNAQQLLTSGNTAVGNQFQGLGAGYGGVRTTDIGQATAAASGMNDAARTAAAQYGIDAQMYGQGMQTQLGAGQQFGAQNLGAQQFEAQNSQQYADWLQRQFSLAMGIPVDYSGQNVQRDIANQQLQTQREGALIGAGGTILSALL